MTAVDPQAGNDYRVLQPALVTDPNRNRTEVAFDTLGMVVGTAVMGKPLPAPVRATRSTASSADLTQAQLDGFYHLADPLADPHAILLPAPPRAWSTTSFAYQRTQQANPTTRRMAARRRLPPWRARPTTAIRCRRRRLKIQHSFSYSDGFGREIQKKIQAEPGPLVDGGPVVSPRWVGSGWTIFNNKGKPVRQYEPFFSATHRFEFGVQVGVSPILFYDPVERVVATLHPNHTYEKVVFDPWRQATWDVNDTVLRATRAPMTRHPGLTPPAISRVCPRALPRHLADLARTATRRRAWGAGAGRRRQGGRPRRHAHDGPLRHAGPPVPDRCADNGRLTRRTTWPASKTASPPASSWTSRATSAPCATPSSRRATRRAASSCATTTTCSATASTSSAWRRARAGC